MLAYWSSVLMRATTASWGFVAEIDTALDVLRLVVPFVIAALIYLYRWGPKTLKQEHLKPALVIITSYALFGAAVFLFNLCRMPSVIQAETEDAGFNLLQEQNDAYAKSRDIQLLDPSLPQLSPLEAAELVSLRDRVKALDGNNESLRRQVTNRAEQRKLATMAVATVTRLQQIRLKCREMERSDFINEANRELTAIATALSQAGFASDAQQILNGNAPLGMPRLALQDCVPHQENYPIMVKLVVQEYILTDIASRLGR